MAASEDTPQATTISKRQLDQLFGKVRQASVFHEVVEDSIRAGQNWHIFDFQQPAYVADPRIGPCLIHGQGIGGDNEDRLLVYPITIGESPLQNTGGIGRDKWYSIPKTVFVTEYAMRLDYVFVLDAIITNAVMIPGDVNVGKSMFTVYEVVHAPGQKDSAKTTTMTLDQLQREIDNGNMDYKRALDVFSQSNMHLSKNISLLSKHEVTPEADQLIIGAPLDNERLDRWTLAPAFLQRYLRP